MQKSADRVNDFVGMLNSLVCAGKRAKKMPFFFRLVLFCGMICFPLLSWSQTLPYKLTGILNVNTGGSYKFHLVIDKVDGYKVSGYSLTWLDGNEPNKAIISGVIDTVHKTLTFSETRVVSPIRIGVEMCLVSSKLTYKLKGNRYAATGKFTGKDQYGRPCGDGNLSFTHPLEKDLMPRPHKKADKPVKQSSVEPLTPTPETITEGKDRKLSWHADSCVIDIWDYGTEDGDIITLLFNNEVILSRYKLTGRIKQLHLPLQAGANTLTIRAENEGRIPPNTARIHIQDAGSGYDFTAYNEAGKEATILLNKVR